jgi:hypothetical protein
VDADLAAAESKLAKPLPAKSKALARTAVEGLQKASKERQKFKLPEGSEPCTLYIPSGSNKSKP